MRQLVDDGILAIVGGADTVSGALTSVLYCLLTHPEAYEKLKEVTRGKSVLAEDLHQLIRSLDIPEADKQRLLAMTPASYIGKATELAQRV